VLLLLTEWAEFRELDPAVLGKAVVQRNMVDGRNALDPNIWQRAGWHYRALGCPEPASLRVGGTTNQAVRGREWLENTQNDKIGQPFLAEDGVA
jgi:hypothetical protein